VKEDALKELDQELRLTAVALGEKNLKTKVISETVLAVLDQYSDRLVSMFDEKLRLLKVDSSESVSMAEERPKTANSLVTSSILP
jgi:hypothetical protein